MTILPQEVWFAQFPFDDENMTKVRPVIVLDVDDDTCTVLSMKVTSAEPYDEFSITLYDWAKIPLNHPSTAVASSVKVLSKNNFCYKKGRLSDDDWDNVTDLYYRYLKSIGFIN